MMQRAWWGVAPWLAIVACVGGCTASRDNLCSPDPGVICPSGGHGYSCTGTLTPNQSDPSLGCSDGVAMVDLSVAYCCAAVPDFSPGGACSVDAHSASCAPGSFGFSCTGSTRPDEADPSLLCSVPTVTATGSLYCCISGYTYPSCTADPSVQGCTAPSYGFSCTGPDSPSVGNANLSCSASTAGSGSTSLYCCQDAATLSASPTCAMSASVTGCQGGSTGVACTGSAVPDPSMNCSAGVPGASGDTYYCCGGMQGACMADGTVTGCQAGALGYSCTGSLRPDATNMLLQCSNGTAAGSSTAYCCLTASSSTSSTCTIDPSVAGCGAGSYGFACSGLDSPSDANPQLRCSPGTAGNGGDTLYCCQ